MHIRNDSSNELSKDAGGLTLKFNYQKTDLHHLLNSTCVCVFSMATGHIYVTVLKFKRYMYLSIICVNIQYTIYIYMMIRYAFLLASFKLN